MADFGYDISDFTDIDPIFGTIDDFTDLTAAAKAKGFEIYTVRSPISFDSFHILKCQQV